jgi:hypothetical protein
MPEAIADPLLPAVMTCSQDRELRIFKHLVLIPICVALDPRELPPEVSSGSPSVGWKGAA